MRSFLCFTWILAITFAKVPFAMAEPTLCAAETELRDKLARTLEPCNGSLRILVGLPPGGGLDALTRFYAHGLARFGLSAVVENRDGASGNVAAQQLIRIGRARGREASCTIMSANFATLVNNALLGVPDAPRPEGYKAIAYLGETPLLLAVPQESRFATLDDLLRELRSSATPLNYATSSQSGVDHFAAAELITRLPGSRATAVHYRGGAPAAIALAGRQVDFAMLSLSSLRSSIEARAARVLAVSSASRLPGVDAPTIHESVPGFQAAFQYALVSHPGFSEEASAALNEAAQCIAQDPASRARLSALQTINDGHVTRAELARRLARAELRANELIRSGALAEGQ